MAYNFLLWPTPQSNWPVGEGNDPPRSLYEVDRTEAKTG